MIHHRGSTSTVTVLFIKEGKIDLVVELVCMFLSNLNFKFRCDLDFWEPNVAESLFIEIVKGTQSADAHAHCIPFHS